MTMNDTWGYKHDDDELEVDTRTLVRTLVDIASKGGNFLLNVGPTAEGLIPAPSVERLAAIGRWLRNNGESIYGTSASPVPAPAWGRLTRSPAGSTSTSSTGRPPAGWKYPCPAPRAAPTCWPIPRASRSRSATRAAYCR